ncbi:MAG: hybrid sensor histidine kinase/response regulator [Thermodesulfobacteriota bacterium]|nr:hybrid sensor histidine kinase/response regulator [Thermodesulfobacteriota bacterium]
MNEEELLKKLRAAFSGEADERLASLSSSLLDLEKGAGGEERAQALEVAFREAHSLKGAARSVNLTEIETICQAVEGVFAAMKRDEVSLSGELFDLLQHCVRAVEDSLAASEGEGPDQIGELATLVSQLQEVKAGKEMKVFQRRIRKEPEPKGKEKLPPKKIEKKSAKEEGAKEKPAKEKPAPKLRPPQDVRESPHKPLVSESVRISTAKLDLLFLKAEELVSLKLASGQHLVDLKEIVRSIESWNKRWGEIEPEVRALDKMAQGGDGWDTLSRFLGWNHDFIRSLGKEIWGLTKESEQEGRTLGLMVDDLLDDMKRIAMLPFSTLLDIFPRMIREISRDQEKEVDLIVEGGEVEIDRRILEEMRDPITHLLRNSIDHGLEAPGKREKQGKPRNGTIHLTVSQTEGGKVEILISDDGAGIDLAQVKKKAASLGVITEQDMEQLSDRDASSLILESGVSTSPIITEISGRGLGLAIVQEKVENLGGRLSLDSTVGRGTSFRMELPVTIATFRGILVRVADRSFIVPSSNMDRTLRVHRDEIKTVENRAAIPLNGKALSLVDLARVFGLKQKKDKSDGEFLTVAVLGAGERRIGFRVDEVLGEQEVLVKGLGKQLKSVPNISGATILGSGRVVPILNVNDLLTSPLDAAVQAHGLKAAEGNGEKKSILVVEDSITSRMLLKSILEGAGYSVKTAVDGSEAYTTLKTGEFDLVVSDIEMPRLDGFGLTKKIRSDKKYAEIPVILVTGLETQEDREKGIDAGANAYIVKSSFDQSNLLEVIKRMI